MQFSGLWWKYHGNDVILESSTCNPGNISQSIHSIILELIMPDHQHNNEITTFNQSKMGMWYT